MLNIIAILLVIVTLNKISSLRHEKSRHGRSSRLSSTKMINSTRESLPLRLLATASFQTFRSPLLSWHTLHFTANPYTAIKCSSIDKINYNMTYSANFGKLCFCHIIIPFIAFIAVIIIYTCVFDVYRLESIMLKYLDETFIFSNIHVIVIYLNYHFTCTL